MSATDIKHTTGYGAKNTMGSKVGKLLGTVAPIAASFIPGVGPALGAAIGAGGGLLSGGGLKGALLGGATGALGSGLGSSIAGAAGLTGAGAKALSGGLTGAAAGLASGGGLKSALLGAGLGGAGGYALGGGIPSLGTAAGTPLSGGLQGPTQGSGIIGGITKTASDGLSSLTGGGGLKSLLTPASTIFSGVQSYSAQDEMKKQLEDAQRRSQAALDPYNQAGTAANSSLASRLNAGFSPGDLASDPGYQFRLEQGQKSLNRSLGAQGSLFSGKALKAASDYGQGMASSEYDDAYKRWLDENQQLAGQAGQGLGAANALTGVNDNQGNIDANATLGQNNIISSTLSSLLSGTGKRSIVGYRPDGTPIYDDATGNNYKLVSA